MQHDSIAEIYSRKRLNTVR